MLTLIVGVSRTALRERTPSIWLRVRLSNIAYWILVKAKYICKVRYMTNNKNSDYFVCFVCLAFYDQCQNY